eukprot:5991637-Amphidinium_carterae.1
MQNQCPKGKGKLGKGKGKDAKGKAQSLRQEASNNKVTIRGGGGGGGRQQMSSNMVGHTDANRASYRCERYFSRTGGGTDSTD